MGTPAEASRILQAATVEEVVPLLEAVEAHAVQGGRAIGFLSYESAPAFEPKMRVHDIGNFPFAWFLLLHDASLAHHPSAIILRHPREGGDPAPVELSDMHRGGPSAPPCPECWSAHVSESEYLAAIAHIKSHIAAGDTYQVNYTFPMSASFTGDARALFGTLCAGQGQGEYYFLDTGSHQILCASPELFFAVDGDRIIMRPMKGTRSRGRWLEEDVEMAEQLRASAKDRAENVMIVDMIRNDLGRIAAPGTVQVEKLFEVERYETVWQMTSTVAAKTTAPLPELMRALFPSASVTGAPKIETMKIIHALEQEPRRAYCGAIGWWGPGRKGRFSVGIRTAMTNTAQATIRYHVGSGITWDSDPAKELAECRQKAAILYRGQPQFELLETLLYEDSAYFLLDLHLERMEKSAEFFGFRFDRNAALRILQSKEKSLTPAARARVRLLARRDGAVHAEHALLPASVPGPLRICLARQPVSSSNVFLFHKTTHRNVYDEARASAEGVDDVLLWNERGELTESTIGNIVLQDAQGLWTPPRSCGLLAGVFREHLLRTGEIKERRIQQDEIGAGKLFLINSVRRWVEVNLVR